LGLNAVVFTTLLHFPNSCVFDNDLAVSSGGAVVVEGAIDPDTAEPTTARFHDCVFTRACVHRDVCLCV
jgi:hypothetical protein